VEAAANWILGPSFAHSRSEKNGILVVEGSGSGVLKLRGFLQSLRFLPAANLFVQLFGQSMIKAHKSLLQRTNSFILLIEQCISVLSACLFLQDTWNT
jgi:hypothetical protein